MAQAKKRHSQTAAEVAAQRAGAVVDPQVAALQAALAARQRDLQGFGLAAAELLKGVGGTVNDIYAGAADRSDAYSRGLAIGQRLADQGAAVEGNALLSQHGAPTRLVGGPEAGNVLQGLGALPAQSLSREGAAFGAAAAMLPGAAIGRTQQDLLAGERGTADQVAQLNAQRPALFQQNLSDIQNRNLARQQFEEAKRAARAGEAIQGRSVDTTAAYLADQQRRTGANVTGIDPATGLPTYEVLNDAADRAAATQTAAARTRATRATNRNKALNNRAGAIATAKKQVFNLAKSSTGKLVRNPDPSSFRNPGIYLDANGKGTNDPGKAKREGATSWPELMQRADALVGDELRARYALKPAEVKTYIRQSLIAAGFRPPRSRKPRNAPPAGMVPADRRGGV